ncbi:MAG: hypothetical protein K2X27_13315 [Candidatus Obscuribacterales bacterium]|nr:hypothetical protein [Candidatus Obscuribacterales bacterium]
MSKNRKNALKIVPGQDLHPAHLARIIKASQDYTAEVNANRIEYPDPDSIDFSADDAMADYEVHPKGFLTNQLGQDLRSKAKGAGGGKPQLPNPQVVLAEVQQYYSGVPVAGTKGNLVLGELNVEFGDASKAKFFRDAYVEIISHLHMLAIEEVDAGWVNAMAGYLQQATGLAYQPFTSTANTRNQAVGFLIHPRLKVVKGPIEYMQVATVQGIPDLRPAFRLDLEDSTTGVKFSATVVHLKSMRGGPAATSAVRYKQLDILQKLLGPTYSGFVVGDMNYIITDKSLTDGDPLKNNGFQLFAPNDTTPTQAMGSRIDGWFYKNLSRQFKLYQVRRFYANPKVTRAFCDHAQTEGQMVFCESQFQLGSTPNPGCPGGLDEKNVPTDVTPSGGDVHFKPLLPGKDEN